MLESPNVETAVVLCLVVNMLVIIILTGNDAIVPFYSSVCLCLGEMILYHEDFTLAIVNSKSW